MTFHGIISRESQNEDSIYLYREGMFMKAYERSAFSLIRWFMSSSCRSGSSRLWIWMWFRWLSGVSLARRHITEVLTEERNPYTIKAVLGCILDMVGISRHRHRRIGWFFCDDDGFCPWNPIWVHRHRKNALFLRDDARKTAEVAKDGRGGRQSPGNCRQPQKIQYNPCNSQNHWINLLPLTENETSWDTLFRYYPCYYGIDMMSDSCGIVLCSILYDILSLRSRPGAFVLTYGSWQTSRKVKQADRQANRQTDRQGKE